jgi:CRP-like cAMP-binding protein
MRVMSDTKLARYLMDVRKVSVLQQVKRPTVKSPGYSEESLSFLPEWLKMRKEFLDEYLNCPSFDLIDKAATCEKPADLRNKFEKEALIDWVRRLPDLSWMSSKRIREICDKLTTVKYRQGEVLMIKGDSPDFVVLLLEGVVGVYIEPNEWMAEVKTPNVIGEAALKGHKERTATLVAHTPVVGLRLRSSDYQNVVFKEKTSERREKTRFLASIPYFSSWKTVKIDRLSSKIMVKSFQAGQTVYHQNDSSVNVLVIKSGHVDLEAFVEIEAENRWPTGKKSWDIRVTRTVYKRTVRSCRTGDIFGEKEVIKACRRSMRAVCREDTVLYIIERDLLYDVLQDRDLKQLLALNGDEPEMENLKSVIESDHSRQAKTKKSILDAFGVNPLPCGRPTTSEIKHSKRYLMASTVIQRHRRTLSGQRVKSSHELIRINKESA